MATLTEEQTDFLKSHHIPLDKTFDASGLSNKEYKAKMKENGTLVAFGVVPCKEKGHTLCNKQANCLQCNPQAIASLKRQATAGDVYIAVSPSQLLTKIGVSETADTIIEQMNAENHADSNDWQRVLLGKTDSIRQLENHLQQRLANRQIAKKLTQDSKKTKASGIYDIDIHEALAIINEQPFTLVTLNNSVLETFHQGYSEREHQRQQQAAQLAEAQAREQHAKAQAEAKRKQAQLDAERQRQQALKQQKLEQQRLRQQQLDAKKAEKQQKNAKQPAIIGEQDRTQVEGVLVATRKTVTPVVPSRQPFSIKQFPIKQPLIWLIVVGVLLIVVAIIGVLMK